MNIVKVFGTNLKNIVQLWEYLKKHLPTNVECTELILAPLNVIDNIQRIADALEIDAYKLLLENQEESK